MISTGSFCFPFKEASKVAISSVLNLLTKNKTVKKVYIVVYSTTQYNLISDVYSTYMKNSSRKKNVEKRMIELNAFESQKTYFREIWHNDSSVRNIHGVFHWFRILLNISQYAFPSIYLRFFFGRYGWKARRLAIEVMAILKIILPLILFAIYKLHNNLRILIALLISYMLLDTIHYVSSLIFLSDIHKESANPKRSIVLLFGNYLEINLSFALLYYLFDVLGEKGGRFINYIHFSLINSSNVPPDAPGKVMVSIQCLMITYFVGVVLSYFISNLGKHKFYEEK